MSSVKISQLSEIDHLNINTDQTVLVGVDLLSDITGKITITTLAEGLYSQNPLKVGYNQVFFPNTVGQFSGNSASYLQVNMQNYTSSGSGDFVVTADTGSDTSGYIDLGINNSGYSDINYSSMYPYDGYLYVHGTSSTSNDGNLIIGTATSNTNIKFIIGGTTSNNIVGNFSSNSFTLGQNVSLVFSDGSKLTNISPIISAAANTVYLQGGLNSANSNTVYLFAVSSLQNTNIGNANTLAQSAFTLANTTNSSLITANTFLRANDTVTLNSAKSYTDSANTQLKAYTDGAIGSANTQLKAYTDGKFLANTNGNTFDGTLNISDKLNVNGSVVLANTQFTSSQAALTIAACPIGDIQLPSNDGYMIHISGKQNVASRLVIDSFGANTYGLLAGRTARGTHTAPQAVANNDVLLRMSGNGYGSTQFAPLGIARIDIVASENYTDSARGSRIEMWNIPNGSNTLNRMATFNGNFVEFTGVVEPKKGFILTPNVISGSTTTLNIDIANNSLYKCSSGTGLTVNLSGFQYGKVVELWFVNTAGTNQTVTHGCSSLNSTINATTFTIPGTSSVYLKYFSIDGDLANTFVAIQHA